MNKPELVSALAEKAEVCKKDAEAVLNAFVETVIEKVTEGEKVALIGFGTFERRERAAREGRNPRTKEIIQIPATNAPAFSAGKTFKDRVK